MADRDKEAPPDCGKELERIKNFTKICTMHGVKRTSAKGKSACQNLFWVFLTITMAIMFATFLVYACIYYREGDVVTGVEYMNVLSLDAPSITICNVHVPFRKSHVQQLARNISVPFDTLKSILNNEPVDVDTLTRAKLDEIDMEKLSTEAAVPFSIDSVEYCTINNHDCFKTTKSSFKQGGYCHTIHSSEYIESEGPVQIDSERLRDGFSIKFDTQIDETLQDDGFNIVLQVHSPMIEPFANERGTVLNTGTYGQIRMKHHTIHNLPASNGNSTCLETRSPLFKNPLKDFKYYSKPACIMECLHNLYREKCGCFPFQDLSYIAAFSPFCNISFSQECSKQKLYTKIDTCHCQEACQNIKYPLSITMQPSPNAIEVMKLKEKQNRTLAEDRFLNNYYLTLHITYEELVDTVMSQALAYPLMSLVGEVGGMLGLCLGASILTIIEILEFTAEELVHGCNKARRRRRQSDYQQFPGDKADTKTSPGQVPSGLIPGKDDKQ